MADFTYDMAQATKLLKLLDPDQNSFCFQFFKKEKDESIVVNKPPIRGKILELESVFSQNQIGRYNANVVLNGTDGASRRIEDVTNIRVAFLDFDSKMIGQEVKYAGKTKVVEQLDPQVLADSSYPPHLIVCSSPNNYHAYWALEIQEITDTAASATDFKNLQTAIAEAWGGDAGVLGLNQCARLPGFWRFKDDDDKDPSLVSILFENEVTVRYKPSLLLSGIKSYNRPTQVKTKKIVCQDIEEELPPEDGGTFVTDSMKANALSWLTAACKHIGSMREGSRDNEYNKICYTAGGYIASDSLDYGSTVDKLRESGLACGLPLSVVEEKLKRVIKNGAKRPMVKDDTLISLTKTHVTAEKYIADNFRCGPELGGVRSLHYVEGNYWAHYDGCYNKLPKDLFVDMVGNWLKTCKVRVKTEDGSFLTKPFYPKMKDFNEISAQCSSVCRLDVDNNEWLDNSNLVSIKVCVPFSDGILNAENDSFYPTNPNFFNKHACPIPYGRVGGETPEWDKFLQSISQVGAEDTDQELIDLLQEWMGYILTLDTSRHKMLVIVGPSRAGKGTLERVIRNMLGDDTVSALDPSALVTDFSYEPLVDKRLSIAADYRNVGKVEKVTSALLKIVANDSVSLNEKGVKGRTIRLDTKVMLFSNEPPVFMDPSGAMASRALYINLTRCFVNREDLELSNKLHKEIEGIVSWSLVGLKRLLINGKFTVPESSKNLRAEARTSDSTLFPYSRDRLIYGPQYACSKESLYEEYVSWCGANGHSHPWNKQRFLREMTSVVNDTTANDSQYHVELEKSSVGRRENYYRGVGVLNDPHKDTYTKSNPPHSGDKITSGFGHSNNNGFNFKRQGAF